MKEYIVAQLRAIMEEDLNAGRVLSSGFSAINWVHTLLKEILSPKWLKLLICGLCRNAGAAKSNDGQYALLYREFQSALPNMYELLCEVDCAPRDTTRARIINNWAFSDKIDNNSGGTLSKTVARYSFIIGVKIYLRKKMLKTEGNTVAPACMVHACKVNPLVWSIGGWSLAEWTFN